ncbi:hypothetical protein BGW41_007451 [Actinomortierella wolfii]|nr:hypothetical protein BGW41_007451 [Actinomortierella wolfii]
MTVGECVRQYGLHNSSIQSVLRVFEQTGRMSSLPRGGNRKRVLSDEQTEWVAVQLDLQPELTIERMCSMVNERWGLSVSISTMCRYITSLRAGFRLTPLPPPQEVTTADSIANSSISSFIAATAANVDCSNNASASGISNLILNHNDSSNNDSFSEQARISARQLWANNVRQEHESMDDFCFVGITEFDVQCGHRIRALRGANSSKNQDGNTTRKSGSAAASASNASRSKSNHRPILLIALDKSGVVCSELNMKPSVTATKAVENFFLKKLVPSLSTGKPGVIAIDMDWFPKVGQEVRQALEQAHLTVITIPNDINETPSLNAAHEAFRHVKLFVRQCDSQTETVSSLPKHIDAALDKITKVKAQEWIAEAGRSLISVSLGQIPVPQEQAVVTQEPDTHGQVPVVQDPISTIEGQVPSVPGQNFSDLAQNYEMLRQMLST